MNRPLDAGDMTFDDNRAQRLLIALVLDTSKSMSGTPISLLNDALTTMADDLRRDAQLSAIAEVAIVTFGDRGVTAWRGEEPAPSPAAAFVPAAQLRIGSLQASGVTPMVEAVELAMRCVAEKKAELKGRHLQYYRPLIWLISDGVPTDSSGKPTEDWRPLPDRIREAEAAKRFAFFSISAGDITPQGAAVLEAFAPEAHLRLSGFEFSAVLPLVSASAESTARGDTIDAMKRRVTQQFRQIPLQRS
jgi:uncharacterized protein YegL